MLFFFVGLWPFEGNFLYYLLRINYSISISMAVFILFFFCHMFVTVWLSLLWCIDTTTCTRPIKCTTWPKHTRLWFQWNWSISVWWFHANENAQIRHLSPACHQSAIVHGFACPGPCSVSSHRRIYKWNIREYIGVSRESIGLQHVTLAGNKILIYFILKKNKQPVLYCPPPLPVKQGILYSCSKLWIEPLPRQSLFFQYEILGFQCQD